MPVSSPVNALVNAPVSAVIGVTRTIWLVKPFGNGCTFGFHGRGGGSLTAQPLQPAR